VGLMPNRRAVLLGPRAAAAAADVAYADAVLADGPALYWRLGEASGTTAANLGSASGDGTYTGTPTLAQPGLLPGDADTCAKFNGDYVDGGALTATALGIANNADRTIECWLKVEPSGSGGTYRVPWAVGGGSQPAALYIGLSDTASPTAWEIGLWGGVSSFTMPSPVAAARHVALTYAGATKAFEVFVDGVSVHTYTHGANLTTVGAAPFDAGWLRPTAANHWAGWLDEVAVYASVLSGARIAAHFAAAS
jgi:hypothetical protein